MSYSPDVSAPATEETLYCANHPGVETLLRCNRCNKPICLRCAVQTDVGYRCKECIRSVQNSYFNAALSDNPIAFIVGMLVTAIAAPIAGLLIGRFGFFGLLIAFFIGSGAGGILAQIIRWSVGKRRGRYLRYFALAGIVLGIFVGSMAFSLFWTGGLGAWPHLVFSLPMLLFTILSTATAFQLLR